MDAVSLLREQIQDAHQWLEGTLKDVTARWEQWARRIRIDLAALRQYAQAVYAATDQYLASLQEGDLGRTIDLSGAGLSQPSLAWLLSGGVLGHLNNHCGEVSCLKGLQGAQGYPA